MPISAEALADQIAQHMRRHNRDVVTLRWSDFYVLCERERLKSGFYTALAKGLAKSSVLFLQGTSTVVFVKDFDFAPYGDRHFSGK